MNQSSRITISLGLTAVALASCSLPGIHGERYTVYTSERVHPNNTVTTDVNLARITHHPKGWTEHAIIEEWELPFRLP